ncbi:DUF1735 domain-containing protein [Mariniflexile sp. AS56]|uniref:DUF1735 domain-containing protein n=1 Tax=Mariniflexile sp. AS56 TaxID=3063957 RepID=UPI0026ED89F7|nr:DUF1735 domain-containing protein [Mariniflexile sp. AS56]MDO7172508.1 DUF1735 domain-containing protein [Mariniflexile sp. AS56]
MKYKNCLFFVLLLSVVVSCDPYEDYIVDTAGYKTVYFPYQNLERSAVSGEGLEIQLGVFLGGVRENNNSEEVTFEIDETLLDGTDYTLLPSDYYTLGNNSKITIEKGEYLGLLAVKFDSLKLAGDTNLKEFKYALPLKLLTSSTDSILDGKGHAVFPIKLMNTYAGNFYQVGSLKEFFTASKVLDTAYVYGDYGDLTSDINIRTLSSDMMNTVTVDGVSNRGGDNYSMQLRVNPQDNSVEILPVASSDYQVASNGASTWDPVKRIFNLKYKYSFGDKDFEIEEALTFRNRIRDGINEWRWEGFPGN